MFEFEFEVDGRGIDFGLCVSSGQVFRWRRVFNPTPSALADDPPHDWGGEVRESNTEREGGEAWEGAIGGSWWRVVISSAQHRLGQPHPQSLPEGEGRPVAIPCDKGDGPRLTVQSNQPVEEFVRVFGLDRGDREWFAGVLRGDPELADAVEGCAGLRLIRQDDPVEVLFSFLCSANNHVRRIEGMVGCLAESGEAGAFPGLEVLAGIEGPYLRSWGFGYRAERIPACAQTVLGLGGLEWLEGLKQGDSGWAVAELQRLPGVGPKVAECVALFGLGHGEVVPIDTHIWNAVRRRYFPELAGGSLTLGRRKMVGDFMRERFGRDAGLAHLVLFVDEMRNWRSRR